MKKKIDDKELLDFERVIWQKGLNLIAGVDEVGRGCLAGPVVAAAVILVKNPKNLENLAEVNDSKVLKPEKREFLFDVIKENILCYGLGIISNKVIDEINILQATFLAMRDAIKNLEVKPEFVFVDGNKKIPEIQIPQKEIIKGDSKSLSIAAASILAKVTRDRIMSDFSNSYPEYKFDQHKGYATEMHRSAIKEVGLTEIHRKTFCKNIFAEQMKILF